MKDTKKPTYVKFNALITPEQYDKLRKIAYDNRISMSDALRKIIDKKS